jgi:hypothetical protein
MKNDFPDVTNVCTVNPDREHCSCFKGGRRCCDCGADAERKTGPKVFNLITHIHNQREHSLKTFGPLDGGQKVQGILKHIEKEVNEIRKDPTDLEEYIDVMILAMDAAYRSGFTPEQIAEMLMKKQLKNECREWPDYREVDLSQPLEHIRTESELKELDPNKPNPPPLTFKHIVRSSKGLKYHAIYTNPSGMEFEATIWNKVKPEPPTESELPKRTQERFSFDGNGSPI